jgi:hypothetical protein
MGERPVSGEGDILLRLHIINNPLTVSLELTHCCFSAALRVIVGYYDGKAEFFPGFLRDER